MKNREDQIRITANKIYEEFGHEGTFDLIKVLNDIMNQDVQMLNLETARTHFERLPEPYKSQALKNSDATRLRVEYATCADALYYSFEWYDSPEGEEYWRDFWEKRHVVSTLHFRV